ncbi:DUF6894 family protein [Bradyrhizobium sp. BWC-3-1]|uniref:DUF6894 family protein n=1 Tax=Bradyrhizobium sp. BWC-3-1 TaxID=3080012 RepID=UPI00397E4217
MLGWRPDGTALKDPSGLDCRDDEDALAKGRTTASEIASAPRVHDPRRIAIEDEASRQVTIIPVINHHTNIGG